MNDDLRIGVDIGAVTIGLAVLEGRRLVARDYRFHRGEIRRTLAQMTGGVGLRQGRLALSGRGARVFPEVPRVHDVVAAVEGAKWAAAKPPDSLLLVGGESVMLIRLAADGSYAAHEVNTDCASGTGVFLDQQAARLGMSTEQFSELAARFSGTPPSIATRCAVFAKTDLVLSQQKGHSLAGMAAGLGDGVARCLAETLIKDPAMAGAIAMAGGVALNRRVVTALEQIVGRRIEVLPQAVVIPAIGAALVAADRVDLAKLETEIREGARESLPLNPELALVRSAYPAGDGARTWREGDIEITLYEDLVPGRTYRVFLGLDIGSTSTKLALTEGSRVLVGLYTYTRSAAVRAVQRLLGALTDLAARQGVKFVWRAAGTTGSGRQLIGRLIHADLVVNEISAHAKAACSLDPDVDTIIEIGGQDSKFIRVQNGAVVQAIMNYICAAGTGSFIEEQAERLAVPLSEYAALAMGRKGPVISDRCTVHMERDLSRLLADGWPKEELLASVLHSVRDNYLMRVVGQAKIGERVCFQGATARNKALVAAFEVALGRAIHVSPQCHLAGAIGVCLLLRDSGAEKTSFTGPEFAGRPVDQRSEECLLCRNRCAITVVSAGGENVAWGFQCGREYEDASYKEKTLPFEPILKTYRRIFEPVPEPESRPSASPRSERIGLPNALPMVEFLPFWEDFFRRLGFAVIISPQEKGRLKEGKSAARAEFCSPMLLAHGHSSWLAENGADFIFFPIFFQGPWPRDNRARSFFCYYASYLPVLLGGSAEEPRSQRFISPVIDFQAGPEKIVGSLSRSLGGRLALSRSDVRNAFDESWSRFLRQREGLAAHGRRVLAELEREDATAVVLLGRPYNFLDPSLNQGISELIQQRGCRVLTQDMLAGDEAGARATQHLQANIHWHYGRRILQALESVVANERLFPVYLTNFRCSPDAFLITYFRDLMEARRKPYLVLQLDELSSEVGYQTRIEAGLESFRNSQRRPPAAVPSFSLSPFTRNKTWILPHIDDAAITLSQAALRRLGFEAIPSGETHGTVVRGLKLVGGGECVPTAAILGSIIETIRKEQLPPDRTAVLVPSSVVSCNFPQIPLALQAGLRRVGLEEVKIFTTGLTRRSLPRDLEFLLLRVYIMAGLLHRLTAKVRPYEAVPGEAERTKRRGLQTLSRAILERRDLLESFRGVVEDFARVRRVRESVERPRLAILGDLYVVCNSAFNSSVEEAIERAGGEAVPASFIDISHFSFLNSFDKCLITGNYKGAAGAKAVHMFIGYHEKRFREAARGVLGVVRPLMDRRLMRELRRLGIPPELEGETAQNTLQILYALRYLQPDAFVHINPLFCCPGLISTALFRRLEERTGVPVIHLFYDGIHSPNENLEPYIHYLKERRKFRGPARDLGTGPERADSILDLSI
jgi:predicted CoA-substrate-specific enzyme activase